MVNREKIRWCADKNRGIRLIEPNSNLSKEYMDNAEETLNILKIIKGQSNMWLAITKYYFEYFVVYSLFMRLGIKSEIHECTIALCSFLEDEGFLKGNISDILEKDKKLRIDNQYYLKNIQVDADYDSLLNFMLEIKNIIEKMTYDDVKDIREKIRIILE